MSESRSAALMASLAGGYLLGRGGKSKAALGLAMYVASKKLGGKEKQDGQEEPKAGADGAGKASALSRLGKSVRNELLVAGGSAAKAQVNRKIDALAGSIQERTRELSEAVKEPEDEPSGSSEPPEDGESDGENDEENDGKRGGKRSGEGKGRRRGHDDGGEGAEEETQGEDEEEAKDRAPSKSREPSGSSGGKSTDRSTGKSAAGGGKQHRRESTVQARERRRTKPTRPTPPTKAEPPTSRRKDAA